MRPDDRGRGSMRSVSATATSRPSRPISSTRSTRTSGHGLKRIEWLETWPELEDAARPVRLGCEPGTSVGRNGALGYLALAATVASQLGRPPARARLVVGARTFPTGMLGYWTRQAADGGLVAVLPPPHRPACHRRRAGRS